MKQAEPFAKRHPRLNAVLGILLLLFLIVIIVIVVKWIIGQVGSGLIAFSLFIKRFLTTTDQVIVVTMISGTVSIVAVIISSIVGKIVEYNYNVKKYLYDKREEPYKQFIEMIYTILENSKRPSEKQMTEKEMAKIMTEFSKGLTLWGSNRVVKKWLKYRKTSLGQKDSTDSSDVLFQMEDIIYEIRKDVGLGRRLGRETC